jgi:hypothetical protein
MTAIAQPGGYLRATGWLDRLVALKTNFAVKPTLGGDLVLLRPVEVRDAAGLLAVDPETERLTGSHRDAEFTLANLES